MNINSKSYISASASGCLIWVSVGVGLVVLFSGFCALNLFWWFDVQDPDLPGLYDYYAAGVGILTYLGSKIGDPYITLGYAAALAVVYSAVFVPSPKERFSLNVFRFLLIFASASGLSLLTIAIVELGLVNLEQNFLWYCLLAAAVAIYVLSGWMLNREAGVLAKLNRRGIFITASATFVALLANSLTSEGLVTIELSGLSFEAKFTIPQIISSLVLSGILLSQCVSRVEIFVRHLNDIEYDDRSGSGSGRSVSIAKLQGLFYSHLVLLAVSVFAFLILSELSLTIFDVRNWEFADSGGLSDISVCNVLVFAALCISVWFLTKRFRGPSVAICLLLYILLLVTYAYAIYCLGGLRRPLAAEWWSFLAFFICFGAPLLVGESFISNCVLIRGEDLKTRDSLLALLITICSFVLTVSVVLPTEGAGEGFYATLMSPAVSAMGLIIVYVLLPGLCAVGYKVSNDSNPHLIVNSPVSGVCQNGVAALAVVLLLGVLPLEIYLTEYTLLIVAIVLFMLFVAIKLPSICFPLEANVLNLGKVYKEYLKSNANKDLLKNELSPLSLHLQRQAIITSLMLFPLSLIMIAVYVYKKRNQLDFDLSKSDFLNRAWKGLLLRPISKDAMMLFYDLIPFLRKRYSKSDLKRLAAEGIDVAKTK